MALSALEVAVLILGVVAIAVVALAIGLYVFMRTKFRGQPLLAVRRVLDLVPSSLTLRLYRHVRYLPQLQYCHQLRL